ncbi:hypothetical protein CSV80_00785 [Sporosarcina sp. P12(2017)]|uniref:HEPN domain-containing protein n=1 Tax=unclassified Sporosarcina TaxID=2647733 RepID=UPI000C166D40|nr:MULTISPECIES: HEPN domain-containing protein [unclassified Sporosarcina]PIC59091.1 hypothetical protein CSV81_00785 [Sporosarcina sp. P10]PIC62412.1 hypothetical protein CSV80_00785 [Sporosarcina sp. P12(2017)]
MTVDSYVVEKISLDLPKYEVNEFITLVCNPEKENSVIVEVEGNHEDMYISNGLLFYKALQLALPEVNLRVSKYKDETMMYELLKDHNTYLMNYYAASDDDIKFEESAPIKFTEEIMKKVATAHNIVCEHNKKSKEDRDVNQWEPSRWGYSFQSYSSACYSPTVDLSILSIITGIESLLVSGEGPLSYKISMYSSLILSDNYEERLKINKLVKDMYKIRSKVVHGEISTVTRLLKKEDIYEKYFELRKIHSELLIKTFELSEDDLFDAIDRQLFNSPSFN